MERLLGDALRIDFNERGMHCVQQDYGVDNSGSVIQGNLDNFNPDKIFHFDKLKSQKIEIKSLPEYCRKFFTFKVSSLKGCILHKANILVARRKDYFLLLPEAHKWMLDNLEARTDYKGWGGKLCVRIMMDKVHDLIDDGMALQKEWTPSAADYVSQNGHLIFEERRTAQRTYISS